MILETGMLLCWMSMAVQHCGQLRRDDLFEEVVAGSVGQIKLSCADGALPRLARKYQRISGLYEVSCSNGAAPATEIVQIRGDLFGAPRLRYEKLMDKARDEWARTQEWRAAHPQCKHTTAWSAGGGGGTSAGAVTSSGSKEDFSGQADGKKGWCSFDGLNGPYYPGTDDKDKEERWNPDSDFVKNNRREQALHLW